MYYYYDCHSIPLLSILPQVQQAPEDQGLRRGWRGSCALPRGGALDPSNSRVIIIVIIMFMSMFIIIIISSSSSIIIVTIIVV